MIQMKGVGDTARRCQNLVLDKREDCGVRFCGRAASFEVVAIETKHYPEQHYEDLCTQHAQKVLKIDIAPDIRVRRIKA